MERSLQLPDKSRMPWRRLKHQCLSLQSQDIFRGVNTEGPQQANHWEDSRTGRAD